MRTTDYRLTLVVIEGNQSGQRVTVPRLPFLIGRGADCQLRPNSPTVAARHCALLERNGRLLLTDLGSTNGTYVNGVRLDGTMPVGDGDELAVGPLRFRLQVGTLPPLDESSVELDAARTLLDGEPAPQPPLVSSSTPLPPLKTVSMRRTTPATAARGILERMLRNEKNERA
jgi:pSer/pThr/pTyr-binding forkhead associated (FHA) protein